MRFICYLAISVPVCSQNNQIQSKNSNHKNAAYFNSKFPEFINKKRDSAFYYASWALKKAIEESNQAEQANAYRNLASYYYSMQDTLSIEYCRKAIISFNQITDIKGLAYTYRMLGDNYFNFGNTDSAYHNYISALQYFEKLKDINGYLEMLSLMGQIQMQRGDYTKALNIIQKSLKIHETLDDKVNVAEDYNNLGFLFSNWHKFDESILYLSKALQIYESIKDYPNISKELKFIGRIYCKSGEYSKAQEYFNKALINLNDSLYESEISYIYEEIGITFLFQNRVDEAIDYFNKTFIIRSSLDTNNPKNLVALSHAISNLGLAYSDKKEYAIAIAYYKKAIEIEKKHKHLFSLVKFYFQIANSYYSWGKYKTALEYYFLSLDISLKINYKADVLNNYTAISETYKRMFNFEKSLKYYTIYIGLKDSIFNEDTHKQITELQSKFEIDKREKEILILNKDKEINEIALKKEEETVQKQRLLLFVVVLGSVIILAFFIILSRLYKQKKEANQILASQKEEITTQRDELEKRSINLQQAYGIIEHKNKNITSSIKYAQRIQQAILPSNEKIQKLLTQSFIIYKPKDIVSGDFYWLDQLGDDKIYFAAVDCTGHGVPGAFMSIHAYNLLDKALNEQQLSKPSDILNYISRNIHDILHQRDEESSVKDSMDIALCCFDKKNRILEYAGANQPLLIVDNQKLTEYKADRHPVGFNYGHDSHKYKNHQIAMEAGQVAYIFSDGFADQFGGEHNQKYLIRELKKTFQEIAYLPMLKQKEFLEKAFELWKGNFEQVDDVLVMGVRF